MTGADLLTVLPLLILAATAVALVLAIAFRRNHPLAATLTASGVAVAWISLPLVSGAGPSQVTPLIVVDNYAQFFIGLILAASLAVAFLSYGFFEQSDDPEEFYLLLVIATLGATVLAASNHFVSFFLGLETLSVALYALIAYPHRLTRHIEASLKYLILAGTSGAFLLFGLALVYAETGAMAFGAAASPALTGPVALMLLAGWGLMLVGIGFKLAVVPFHLWTPDVYEGAPAPVAAYVATVSKGAIFALLVRFFVPAGIEQLEPVALVLALIAIASMAVGNLLALLQDNIKRVLAYSSIAHMGYLLVAFLAGGDRAVIAVAFYLSAYFVTTLCAFGVVIAMSRSEKEADQITEYRGMFWQRPWLAGILTVSLLSLAGVPLTVGFVGKFYLVLAGVGSTLWSLVLVLIVSSAIGVFYYLRIIVALYMQEPADEARKPLSLSIGGGAALALLTLLLVGLGVYPGPALGIIQAMVARF